MLENEICINEICRYFNSVLDNGKPVKNWNVSNTCMIPKVNKPSVRELRPIALLNVEYKIFMSVMKEKLVEHARANGLMH